VKLGASFGNNDYGDYDDYGNNEYMEPLASHIQQAIFLQVANGERWRQKTSEPIEMRRRWADSCAALWKKV
jgi:hypothetical protein